MSRRKKPASIVGLIVLALIGYAVKRWMPKSGSQTSPSGPHGTTQDGKSVFDDAVRAKRSKVWGTSEAVVVKMLPTDTRGDKHQQWLARLPSGHVVKFAHNIDVAPTVPLRKGDRFTFRGRFEYNIKGGVVHWTHRDSRGRQGGWIDFDGKRYR